MCETRPGAPVSPGDYSRRRLAKAGMFSASAKARTTTNEMASSPGSAWTGRDATCSRAAAVALTALATDALSVVGTCGPRTPTPPLSADSKADRSRIRFKRSYFAVIGARHIGTRVPKV